MKHFWTIAVLIAMTAACTSGALAGDAKPSAAATAAREAFSKTYPNTQVEDAWETPIDGVFEIMVGSQVVYFSPKSELVIIGNMLAKDGTNLTARRTDELAVRRLSELPLDKAVKVGSGKNTVIEITDPDCPYCRRVDEFLKKRTDITRYVFFYPLPNHPKAEPKVKYILCQKSDKAAEALEAVYAGKYDGKEDSLKCEKPEVDARLAVHKDVVAKLRVQGTPMLFINGRVVNGADTKLIEKYLASDGTTASSGSSAKN